jgi:hypothetical protein
MGIKIKDFEKAYWEIASKQFPYGTRTKICNYATTFLRRGLPLTAALYGAYLETLLEKVAPEGKLPPWKKRKTIREIYSIAEEIKSSVLFSKPEPSEFILNPS